MQAPTGVYHRFIHNKGLSVLYIQILIDDKGLPRVYIQSWRSGTKDCKPTQIPRVDLPLCIFTIDSFITKGLPFCIYKYWLKIKDLQACIYKAEYYQRMAGAGRIRFLRYMQRFTHDKGLAVLYIQIFADNKGLPSSYIQTGSVVVERMRTVGVVRAWWQVSFGKLRTGSSASSGQALRLRVTLGP